MSKKYENEEQRLEVLKDYAFLLLDADTRDREIKTFVQLYDIPYVDVETAPVLEARRYAATQQGISPCGQMKVTIEFLTPHVSLDYVRQKRLAASASGPQGN